MARPRKPKPGARRPVKCGGLVRRTDHLSGGQYSTPCGCVATTAYLVRYESLFPVVSDRPRWDLGYETVIGLCPDHQDFDNTFFYKPHRGPVQSVEPIPDLRRAEAERDRCEMADRFETIKSNLVLTMGTKGNSDILESEWRTIFEMALSQVLISKVLGS